MSQKVIIILVLVLFGGGGAWYFLTNMSNSSDATGSQGNAAEKDTSLLDTIADKAGSLAEMLSSGDSLECRFSGTDPDTGEFSEGVVYIDGQKTRMEADTIFEGEEAQVNMIQDDLVLYVWSYDTTGVVEGFKMDVQFLKEMEGYEEETESPIDWLKDPESGADYSCKGWSPRHDSFDPPKDVEFLDIFAEFGNAFGVPLGTGVSPGASASAAPTEVGEDWNY